MNEEFVIKGFIQGQIMRNNGKQELEATENLIERGVIDSMGIVKLLAYLETSFKIDVDDDELLPSNFESVQTIAAFVRKKQRSKMSTASEQQYCQPGI